MALSYKAVLLSMDFRRDFSNARFGSKTFAFSRANRTVLDAPAVTEIASYDQLRQALNQRRVELGMSFEDLDARSGLADRYTTKLLSASPSAHGRYHRNIGPAAMECLLPALKVRIRLEPIDDQLQAPRNLIASPRAALGEAPAHDTSLSLYGRLRKNPLLGRKADVEAAELLAVQILELPLSDGLNQA